MGCAVEKCDRLALENGGKVFGTLSYVCKYAPTFFLRGDGQLYREGPCTESACPTDAGNCVQFGGNVGGALGGASDTAGKYCGESSLCECVLL